MSTKGITSYIGEKGGVPDQKDDFGFVIMINFF